MQNSASSSQKITNFTTVKFQKNHQTNSVKNKNYGVKNEFLKEKVIEHIIVEKYERLQHLMTNKIVINIIQVVNEVNEAFIKKS